MSNEHKSADQSPSIPCEESIDSPEFRKLLGAYSETLKRGYFREADEEAFIDARKALIAHIDAKLTAARRENNRNRQVDEEALATLLWLYRRLPRGYGRPPVVEAPILALSRRTGIDVADCLAERGPSPGKD